MKISVTVSTFLCFEILTDHLEYYEIIQVHMIFAEKFQYEP